MSEPTNYFIDPTHLTAVSYENQSRLQVRIDTHRRYTQPQVDFVAWVLDKISWQGQEQVLDVGCGNGGYRTAVQARGHAYIAGDLSWGMLADLPSATPRLNLDVQALPLATHTADVVLANHMLYHVPNQARALREIRRVLRPNGVLLASTNSQQSRQELTALVKQAVVDLGHDPAQLPFQLGATERFTLENGTAVLNQVFGTVIRHDLDTAFLFPAPEPIMAYVASGFDWFHGRGLTWADLETALRRRLEAHFAQHDVLRVSKKAGVFVCRP